MAEGENTNFTNFFDAGRIQQQVQQTLPATPVLATPSPALSAPTAPPTPESKIHFKLTKVIFIDNKIFSSAELEKIFAAALNHEISLSDLENLVHAVTTKYREAGYILSRAILPPQTIKAGIVKIQIIEGFVSSVSVKGDVGNAGPLLNSYAKHVMAEHPLRINTLERYALLANDLPGFSVQAVLTPSKNVPAGAELTFVASRKVMNGFVTYDNYGTRYIGPQETGFGASLNSVLFPGDMNGVQFSVTSRPHELQYASFLHTQPLGTKGARWQLGTNYAETRPGFVLEPFNIIGRNVLAFMDVSYPWIRERSKNLSFHAAANYQNVTSTILATPFYQDRIRSLDLGGAFNNMDHWSGINTVLLDMTHGFPILGAKDHVETSRPRGQARYTRFNINLSRLQSLKGRFSLLAVIRGQYSFEALLATEQFGIGGSDIGRGYDPSEIVGDNALAGKVELRIDAYPSWRLLQGIQYYFFCDGGSIWNIDTRDFPSRLSATSVGVGARFTFVPQVTGNFYIAKPLDRSVSTLLLLHRNSTAARTFFQITASV